MEKLQRRSDGIAETLSGLFAVSPRRISAQSTDTNSFTFRSSATADPIEVRWRKDDGIAVIDQSTAMLMLTKGYAQNISDEQLAKWNDMIDQLDPDAKNPIHELGADNEPVVIEDQQEGNGEGGAPAAPEGAQENGQSATEGASGGLLEAGATQVANATQNAPEGGSEGGEPATEEGGSEGDQPDDASAEGSEGDQPDGEGSEGEGSEEEPETASTSGRKKKAKTSEKGSLL